MPQQMTSIYSDQYQCNCVIVAEGANVRAEDVLYQCYNTGAYLMHNGIEYVVQLRSDIGPELWTEKALRRSLKVVS